MRDTFSEYHPAINFLYFVLVIGFAMFFMHPVCLCISLCGSMGYLAYLRGGEALLAQLKFLLPMTLMAAVLNPTFNHAGDTVLMQLPSGSPLTLESVLYGVAAAAMLGAVVLWFSCYTVVMTSDKFVYLFGKMIPALSLVLAMTLRFIPRFRSQFQAVCEAQRCVGRDLSEGTLLQRMRRAVTVLSIMLTWSMENAIETADSMKSRGYGLTGRTAFSIYRMDGRDKKALLWLGLCGGYVFANGMAGGLQWQYFPCLQGVPVRGLTLSVWMVYLALCLTPVSVGLYGERAWRKLRRGEFTCSRASACR